MGSRQKHHTATSCLFSVSLILCSILVMERAMTVDSLCLDTVGTTSLHSRHRYTKISLQSIARNGYCKTGHERCLVQKSYHHRKNVYHPYRYSSLGIRLMASSNEEDQKMNLDNPTNIDNNDIGLSSSPPPSNSDEEANGQNNDRSIKTIQDASQKNTTTALSTTAQSQSSSTNTTTTNTNSASKIKWQANNFEHDHQLLKMAMARQSAKTDLQQKQRKYTLDYGFSRNKRPLFRDLIQVIVKIGVWVMFLSSSGGIGSANNGLFQAWNSQPLQSLGRRLHILSTQSIVTLSTLHHWVVGMTLPLFLLMLIKKSEKLGPPGRTLEEYFTTREKAFSESTPSFFYTSDIMSKKKKRDKDTGDFVLCLLESWSSAIIVTFVWSIYSILAASLGKPRLAGGAGVSNIHVCTRLLTRIGAAAAIHQYPSLLFELRRGDQPRPLCRSTAYMQRAVKMLLGWLPLGVASDLAMMIVGNNIRIKRGLFGAVKFGTLVASSLSIIAPLCHLVALGRIVRLSKCSAVSLSEATSFPTDNSEFKVDGGDAIRDDKRQEVKWRYQLRWRTPQRISETLRAWTNYFFTGHVPLLFEMDDWKKQPIRFDDFSTEGTHYLMHKDDDDDSKLLSDDGEQLKKKTMIRNKNYNKDDDSIPHADAIAESLSLIFRDRDAAIRNATQARFVKHQESYDTKTLDDVLGVAVQQTFGIGVSYDFDHFDSPSEGAEVSIHQLRARMAKSAVRRKRELDDAMKNELDVLRRLKENVVTDTNKDVAEKEMKSVELGIRDRHASEVDRMRDALLTLIPTNVEPPKGTEQYDNPIMVAEYVDLKAPVERRGDLKATIASAPDSMSMIEDYVRRDYGDEAADAYRRDEIAARRKEQEMLSTFRKQYGELKGEEITSQSKLPPRDGDDGYGAVHDSSNTSK